jgi:hypothetical protein
MRFSHSSRTSHAEHESLSTSATLVLLLPVAASVQLVGQLASLISTCDVSCVASAAYGRLLDGPRCRPSLTEHFGPERGVKASRSAHSILYVT